MEILGKLPMGVIITGSMKQEALTSIQSVSQSSSLQYLEKRYKKKYTALEVKHLANSILIENNPAEFI